MKVLLVLAAIPELNVNASVRHPIMAPPLTLLLLGAICKQAGHEVELIDTRLFMTRSPQQWVLDYEELELEIARSQSEIAGISFLSSAVDDGFRIAKLCKQYGKTVVGGGLHISVALDECKSTGAFHYLIQGEGEEIFPLLLKGLSEGRQQRFPTPSIVLRANKLKDMQIIPPITDYSIYVPVFEQYASRRTIYVETSRGCVKSCTFCEVARTGAAWSMLRKVPVETALHSIEHAVANYNVNYVLVTDSIATAFKSHFLYFTSRVLRTQPDIVVQFNSTVDCWDEERAKACQELSCNVWFGFETGSQRMLNLIRKGTTPHQGLVAAHLCNRYKIPCAFNVLLGVPGEEEEDYLQTIDVFEKCPWVYPNPNLFNPLPGTNLYSYCLQHGLLLTPNNYDIWDTERVEKAGSGPVKNVDYGLVIKYYNILRELQNEPQRTLF